MGRLSIWFVSAAMLLLFGWPQMLIVEGLHCPVCYRIGKFGSRSCRPMPCNTVQDKLDAWQEFVEATRALRDDHSLKFMIQAGQRGLPSGGGGGFGNDFGGGGFGNDFGGGGFGNGFDGFRSGQNESEPKVPKVSVSEPKTPEYVCNKKLGTWIVETKTRDGGDDQIRLPMTSGECEEFQRTLPPKAEPYTEVFAMHGPVKGGSVNVERMYICDEENQANCQISWSELDRAEGPLPPLPGSSTDTGGTGTGSGQPGVGDGGGTGVKPEDSAKAKAAGSLRAVGILIFVSSSVFVFVY